MGVDRQPAADLDRADLNPLARSLLGLPRVQRPRLGSTPPQRGQQLTASALGVLGLADDDHCRTLHSRCISVAYHTPDWGRGQFVLGAKAFGSVPSFTAPTTPARHYVASCSVRRAPVATLVVQTKAPNPNSRRHRK
jgi:hypothetical protein